MEHSSINPQEVKKFTELANEWWKPNGKFKTLHKFNPSRLDFIIRNIKLNYSISDNIKQRPLEGLSILDIGCGGGLLCEPLSRLGANVTGIDASKQNIEAASIHAKNNNLNINYIHTTVEELDIKGSFDTILNMEVVEHVNNVNLYIKSCYKLLKKNGLMFTATLNRSFISYIKAIIGAEYILRWLPIGTHDWNKFIKPEELEKFLSDEKFSTLDVPQVL